VNYLHYDLGYVNEGAVVLVTLSAQANVKLLDDSNFRAYQRGGRHQYFGGLAKVSPARITVPRSGNWYVTVDLGGYAGRVNASVRVVGN
jgi:hypothetical protein